jgi:hypothetical protein
MPRNKETSVDKIQRSIHDSSVKLTDEQTRIRERLLAAFLHWSATPTLAANDIVQFLITAFGISERQGWRDVGMTKKLLGTIELPGPSWWRHLVLEVCMSAIRMAEANSDPAGMTAAAAQIVRCMKLDKVETEQLPWDQVVPPNFEPSPDISVLGFKPDPNIEEKRRKMREKYLRRYDPDITDAEILD